MEMMLEPKNDHDVTDEDDFFLIKGRETPEAVSPEGRR